MKGHRVIRVYPRAWRERYGAEIEEILAVSIQPIRDSLNLFMFAIAKRLESVMRKLALPFAGLLAAASLFAMGWTTKDLARGVVQPGVVVWDLATREVVQNLVEIPFHWWSTIPVVGLVFAGALALWARKGARAPGLLNRSKSPGS